MAFPSLHGLPADVGSPTSSVLWKAPISASSSRGSPCDRSTAIPWLALCFLRVTQCPATRQDPFVNRRPAAVISPGNATDLPSSQGFLVSMPGSQTPAGPRPRSTRDFGVAFRKLDYVDTRKRSISVLNHRGLLTCCLRLTPNVAADGPRLASGWGPALPGWDSHPRETTAQFQLSTSVLYNFLCA